MNPEVSTDRKPPHRCLEDNFWQHIVPTVEFARRCFGFGLLSRRLSATPAYADLNDRIVKIGGLGQILFVPLWNSHQHTIRS